MTTKTVLLKIKMLLKRKIILKVVILENILGIIEIVMLM